MSTSSAASPNDSDRVSTARGHLERLGRQPRPTGSAAAVEARRYCASVLTSLGFRVREQAFEYSAAVGLYGTSIGGLLMGAVIVVAALASLGDRAGIGVGVLIAGGATIAVGGRWLATRGVLTLPIMRRRGMNLEGTRGTADPRVWLVAHIDSKSQPIPLLVRAAGIILLAAAFIGALLLAIRTVFGHASPFAWRYVIGLAVLGSLPVIASVVGANSPGAVDNASGVATILEAAAALADANIGVLITDAEELGLAGARAWCVQAIESARPRAAVLNCDGVDDRGELALMWTRPRASRLERVLREVSRGEATLRVMPLVPGVLVDGLAFSDAGYESVTISRGSLATLRRIHTRRDNLDHVHGTGLTVAARVLARAARTLTEQR